MQKTILKPQNFISSFSSFISSVAKRKLSKEIAEGNYKSNATRGAHYSCQVILKSETSNWKKQVMEISFSRRKFIVKMYISRKKELGQIYKLSEHWHVYGFWFRFSRIHLILLDKTNKKLTHTKTIPSGRKRIEWPKAPWKFISTSLC